MEFALYRHAQCGQRYKQQLATEAFSRVKAWKEAFESGTPLKWANMLN